jgi:HK97 family phage major capsid protein
MKTLIELRELRAAKIQAQEALVNIAEQEAREFTEAEKASFDQLTTEVEAMHDEVRRAEQVESLRINKAKDAANRTTPEQKVMEKHSLARAIGLLSKGQQLTGAEAEMNQEANAEAIRAGVGGVQGVALPSWAVQYGKRANEYIAGTDGQGGYTVQKEVQPMVEALRPVSVLTSLGATVRSGLQGNLRFPTDGTLTGAWESEIAANNQAYTTIGYVDSSPKRFGAYVDVSKQLLVQSTSISEQYIRRQLELTIGTAIDQAGIEGGGSGEPTGILANAGVTVLWAAGASASGVNANGAALTWGDLTKLYKTVVAENVDMANLAYLTTPGVFEQGSSKPRQTSGVEGNFIFNEAMRAYGQPVVISTNVPSDIDKGSSTDLHAMIFGNFSELALHTWGPGIDIVVDPYTQAGNASVRIIVNTWLDWCITRPKAFAVIKDILV